MRVPAHYEFNAGTAHGLFRPTIFPNYQGTLHGSAIPIIAIRSRLATTIFGRGEIATEEVNPLIHADGR
jgi:hypothetical protein